jgi:hypothetical protein
MFMFLSEQRQKLALEIMAIRNWWQGRAALVK